LNQIALGLGCVDSDTARVEIYTGHDPGTHRPGRCVRSASGAL